MGLCNTCLTSFEVFNIIVHLNFEKGTGDQESLTLTIAGHTDDPMNCYHWFYSVWYNSKPQLFLINTDFQEVFTPRTV